MEKLLIVVDYQKDFVDGALGFAGAELLAEPIAAHIEKRRKEGWRILFTMDTHHENYLSTQEGRLLPVQHCLRGSDGWRLYGAVCDAVRKEDVIIEKGALGSWELMGRLMANPADEIEFCGLVSNMCVISNAVVAKAALPEARVSVLKNLTASFDPSLHEKAMDVMAGMQIFVEEA